MHYGRTISLCTRTGQVNIGLRCAAAHVCWWHVVSFSSDAHSIALVCNGLNDDFRVSAWSKPLVSELVVADPQDMHSHDNRTTAAFAQVQFLCSVVLFGLAHCALLFIIFDELSKCPTAAPRSDVLMSFLISPRRIAPIIGEVIVFVILIFLRTPMLLSCCCPSFPSRLLLFRHELIRTTNTETHR